MKRKVITLLIYILIIIISRVIYIQNEDHYRKYFIKNHQLEALEIREKIQNKVALIYQGLRTISRLPGVKKMDMYSKNINPDLRQSVQEIYNNLNLSIHLSEIYIVPINLDPDKIDPRTNKMQEPSFTFDAVNSSNIPIESLGVHKEEEIEIYEYRMMKKQNSWLKENYPNGSFVKEFNVPMLSGTEVITCDNSNFKSSNPDDKKRSGQVFSVPFFDEKGILKGTISGIVLTDTLANYLPARHYQIQSSINNYLIGSNEDLDKKLVYQEKFKLDFNDPHADWFLVASVPEDIFNSDESVIQIKYFFYFTSALISLFVVAAFYMIEQNFKLLDLQEKALESSSQLASMGEMTANIGHEINNPLSILLMKLNLMTSMNKKGTLTFDRLTVDLDKMQLTADRMAKIIKGLKTLSRNSTADPYEKISIQKIVSESLEFCMDRLKERGIELKLINNLDVQVSCREVQLSQVVINLVNNSSDAILDLESKWIEIEVVKNEEKNTISVIITDSGNGIPLEIANKLMTPFFSTKGVGKGTGLGLSISRKILKEHGGEIRLDQSYHHTRFIIELPV